ncbi:hypothetical protein PMIN04_008700 [Paraphaeosphaeria minitans]
MGRHANPDIRRAFAEFQDQDTPSKCSKVRCLHCGFVRAKNTTRQIEHLHACEAYLASPEAQAWHAQNRDDTSMSSGMAPNSVLSGQQPNPNLQINRRGPNNKRARDGQQLAPNINMPPPLAPSLSAHLLTTCAQPFTQATQQPFLSHAGCGSLAPGPLSQWMAQDGHYARGFIRFVGQLLAKLRLPQTANSQFHPMYRTMDLLISALNNMRREMSFFEITATKYGLTMSQEPPTPITRALLDLFVSASSSSASLLEGMVVLWGAEHVSYTLYTVFCWKSGTAFSRLESAMLQFDNAPCATEQHGNMRHHSAAPSPPRVPKTTSSRSTKPSYRTGRLPHSANSSTRAEPSSTSSPTSQPPATAKRRWRGARRYSARYAGWKSACGRTSTAWARATTARGWAPASVRWARA